MLASYDSIICEGPENLEKIVRQKSVDLTIAAPSLHYLQEVSSVSKSLTSLLAKIAKVTKSNGICCMIVTGDKNAENDKMNMIAIKTMLTVGDSQNEKSSWILKDEIVWIKHRKNAYRTQNELISFEEYPFGLIYVFYKKKSPLEYVDRSERIDNLRISQTKRDEMYDSVWYIPQKSDKKFNDRIPSELALRLLLLYSNKCDVVLDPYAGDGIIAASSIQLGRHYICIDKNPQSVNIAKKRINKLKSM